MSRILLAPIVLLATILVLPTAAQKVPLDASVLETVDVEIVNVEVYVTDNKGRTVDGLTKDDFRLYVDQQHTEIVNFYRAGGGLDPSSSPSGESVGTLARAAAPEPQRVAGSEPQRVGGSDPSAPRSGEAATLVLYVDHLQLTPGGRRAYLQQIRDFMGERLRAGDQLMIVSHDRGLEMQERFTGDFDSIASTLDGLWQAPAGATEVDRMYQRSLDQIENILLTTPPPTERLEAFADPCLRVDKMQDVAQTFSQFVASHVDRSLSSLERLTNSLAAIPGRKDVLYLSNGLDMQPGIEMHLQVGELCPGRSTRTVSAELSTRVTDTTYRIASLANRHGVTLHTLDASRLDSLSSSNITRSSRIEVNGYTFDLRPSAQIDSRRRDNRQQTLYTLARETGGLSILNANEIDGDLAKIEDSLRRFYSLGFRPSADAEEGSSHLLRIELEPPRKGYQLHYRRTHETAAPADRSVGRLMSALLLGMEDNPLGVDIEVGQAEVSETGLPTVPLRIVLPFGSLGWLEHGDQRTGEVELFIAVQSGGEDGEVDMRSKRIPFRIQEDLWAEAKDRSHTLEIGLPVPSLDARLAFAVADLVGQRTSYLSR